MLRSAHPDSNSEISVLPLSSSTPVKNNAINDKQLTPRRANYRRDIRLLRIKLDAIKLKLQQEAIHVCSENKENSHSFLSDIHSNLIETCNQLLTQCRNQDQWAREQQDQTDLMYKSQLSELGNEVTELRTENSKLRNKLILIDSKISEVLSENKYLRWENEQFSQNIESLNLQLNEKSLKINELQAEIHCLKINQVEINRLNALKIQTSIQETRKEERSKFEKTLREYESKYGQDYQNAVSPHKQSSNFDSPKKSSVRFGTVERISPDGQIFRQTVTEWEEKFGVLRREYEMERQQRRNLTKILVEMSRDMKLLLNTNKNGTTTDFNV